MKYAVACAMQVAPGNIILSYNEMINALASV